MKLRHELLVEYAHLAVENQRRRFQRSDRVGELSKTFRVVDVVAADEADARAVVLLLVHPARPVERLGKSRRHRDDRRQRRHGTLLCRTNVALLIAVGLGKPMIIEQDYCGYRIEVEAIAADGRWNADVRMRRLFSREAPRHEVVTCYKLSRISPSMRA